MKTIKVTFIFLAVLGVAFWFITAPSRPVSPEALAGLAPDPVNGELVFNIGGCVSCHHEPGYKRGESDGAEGINLGGGLKFETPFGAFVAPNISPDTLHGIGAWSAAEFATAMLEGVSPRGQHYYPAFPYTAYARMTLQDVVDLKSFMDTLPKISRPNGGHELDFPFSIRRGLGIWKLLSGESESAVELHNGTPEQLRGQYLVEGLGHCGECHTPRDSFGVAITSRWLAGAPNLEGDGRVPNITPDKAALGGWSIADIAEYLSSGFTPDYDVVGGSMAEVVENTSRLSGADRRAIAVYLKAIPALAKEAKK